MKWKSYLLFVIFISLLNKTNALTYICNQDPKIKGPLLIDIDYTNCNDLLTVSSYYLQNPVAGSWSIGPNPSVGTISSQTQYDCIVKWNPSSVASDAYLVFSTGNYTDTLWPQLKCCNSPSGISAKLQDVDDQDVFSAGIVAAFQPYATLLSSNVVAVSGGIFFIEGQLNLQDTKIIFYDCTLYMGSGAVIYTSDGFIAPGSLTATNTHFLGTDCGMWQGIYGPSDSRVSFDNCTVEDAEFAIQTYNCEINLTCLNTIFNNNFVSIFFPHILSGGSNQFSPYGVLSSEFSKCTFGSNGPMILPPFNGQYGLPMDERPFAGMFLNDLVPSSTGIHSIPFSTSSATPCTFHNMNYGIYVRNGQADVYNCSFDNIYKSASYKPDFTSAIFLDNACSYCSTVRTLLVGNSNTNSSNKFDLCEVGVQSQGEVDAEIFSNNFICSQNTYPHNKFYNIYFSNSSGPRKININSNHFSNYNIGIMTYKIGAADLFILNNDFSSDFVLPDYGPFSLTGILLLKKLGSTDIGFNTFNDSRICVYMNAVKGSSPSSRDCGIHDNTINNDISFADLQAHPSNSIWCDYVHNTYIENNYFNRTIPIILAPSDFDKTMRAINIKLSNDLNIFSNTITNFGTPMRFVSNCNANKLQCNTMNQCFGGIYLDVASMTAQGAPGNPWDNSWTSYGNVLRVSGISASGQVLWYHRGATCSSGCTNGYSPGPYTFGTVFPFQNETGQVCYGGGGGDKQKISEIVDNSIQYSDYADQSRYLDKQFAYEALKEDSTLLDSIPGSENYYAVERQSNIGKFVEAKEDALRGDLTTALAKLDMIVDENVIEYNKKYVRKLELQKEISGDKSFTEQETESLSNIAWQTAWEGGDAVFDARRLLMLEVDDQEHHLRISHYSKARENNTLVLYPNPSNGKISFYTESPSESKIRIVDIVGREIINKKLINGQAFVSDLTSGVYFAQLIYYGEIINVKKFIVK